MSNRFPKIHSPCPRRLSELPQPGRDLCSLCERRVHRLDTLSEPERRALLAKSEGPICVAYRLSAPKPSPLRSAAALGLLVALGSGAAASAQSGANFDPNAQQPQVLPLGALVVEEKCDGDDDVDLTTVTVTGGLIQPELATWRPAEELAADLPIIDEDAFLDEGVSFRPTPDPD